MNESLPHGGLGSAWLSCVGLGLVVGVLPPLEDIKRNFDIIRWHRLNVCGDTGV